MATKATKKKGLKVGKLKVNKETIKNLTKADAKKIRGGRSPETSGYCIPPKK